MRVIVCGSAPRRDGRPGWTDRELLFRTLDAVTAAHAPLAGVPVAHITVVEGEADGADKLAREWAEDRGASVEPHPADWSIGRAAGPTRNREMLAAGRTALVVAFSLHWPVVGGTGGMCKLAHEAGVPVRVVTPDGAVRHYEEQLVLR